MLLARLERLEVELDVVGPETQAALQLVVRVVVVQHARHLLPKLGTCRYKEHHT